MALTQSQLKARESKIVGYTSEAAKQTNISKGYVSSSSKASKAPIINTSPTNSIIKNQSNLLSSTDTERKKQSSTSADLDNIVNNLSGTAQFGPNGEYTYKVDAKGNPYGAPISSGGTTKTDTTKKETITPEGNIEDSMGGKYSTSLPDNMSYNLPSPSKEGNKWVYDASGKPFEMDASGKVTSNPIAEQEYNINVQKQKDIETSNKMYDTLKANVSAAHQVVIDNIKKKAQEQKIEMEDLNKRYLAGKQVAGFRTGGTEYTPEIAMGILKNEEEEGIRRIKEIDDNMTLLLAEAVSAKNQDELDVAQQKFETYQKLQSEKEDAIINQYKLYLDNQKYIADTKKALETESRAKEDQAMQILKASADAYVKGYASAKDKNAYVQSIATKLGLDADVVLGQILNAQPKAKTTGSGGLNQSEIKSNAIGEMATGLGNKAGSDGYVDPYLWINARKAWIAKGLNDADFLKNFKQYLNPESYKLVPEFAPKKTTSSRAS